MPLKKVWFGATPNNGILVEVSVDIPPLPPAPTITTVQRKKGLMSSSLNPIDVETGQLRAGFKTTVVALSVVFMAGAAYAAFATKEDIVQAVQAHTAAEFPHTKQFRELRDKANEAVTKAEAAKIASEKTDKRVYGIEAKIDFLIQNEVEKARSSPQARDRAKRAARSVRDRVAAEAPAEDPLGDLGL